MSWIFGIKQNHPQELAKSTNALPSSEKNDDNSTKGTKMAYSFDSTALERAASAAKTLEQSQNAKQVLELSRLQEISRQKEYELQTKQLEARIASMQAENSRIVEEERRKTLIEETKHAKHRAEYQDQLARKRQENELGMKARLQEESLKKQEESVKKQEALRKSTIEHELQLRHKFDLERIEAEVRAKAKAARENRDINLEMMKANHEENRKTIVEKIKTTGTVFGTGLQEFISDRSLVISTVAGLTALAIGWYTAKHGTAVTAKYIDARLGKPSLVRETSRMSFFDLFKHPIKSVKKIFVTNKDPLKNIVLNSNLESRLRDVAITTKHIKQNNGLFRNILLHGPPGTGKTMFAKGLARHSGLDYAIMTGGDVAPMGKSGVSAIHKIFDWAEASRKGLILFIDEGDAFLRKRSTEMISEDVRAMLNAFLYRTGEQSKKFMLIIASNQPEQFDWAVNDRLDELVEFKLPAEKEREKILLQYFKQYVVNPILQKSKNSRLKLSEFDWIQKCIEIAAKTNGMSGRELSKLVISWQASAYASEDGKLTLKIIDDNTNEAIKQHHQKMKWLNMEKKLIEN